MFRCHKKYWKFLFSKICNECYQTTSHKYKYKMFVIFTEIAENWTPFLLYTCTAISSVCFVFHLICLTQSQTQNCTFSKKKKKTQNGTRPVIKSIYFSFTLSLSQCPLSRGQNDKSRSFSWSPSCSELNRGWDALSAIRPCKISPWCNQVFFFFYVTHSLIFFFWVNISSSFMWLPLSLNVKQENKIL